MTADDLPPSAVPVNGLQALQSGDRVLIEGRKIPHTVTAAQRNRARLEGPRGGQIILVECRTPERSENEYIRETEHLYETAYCVERSDGSEPTGPVGTPLTWERPDGLSVTFSKAGDI